MFDHELVKKTEEFLKRKFDASVYLNVHPEEKTYRIEHSYRVANIGREIAVREGFDETEMVIACLLHDISYCEVYTENGSWPEWKNHGRLSARIARPFLEELGLPHERISDICYGIAVHVDEKADFPGENTPFALSVGDADNIDRFDAYRIHETLHYDSFLTMNHEEKTKYLENKLSRLRQFRTLSFATKTADTLWKSRLDFYITFLQKLSVQLARSRSVISD